MAVNLRGIPWRLVGLGLELGMMIGGMAYLGHYADQHFATSPWLTFTGVMLGMTIGCYTLARQVLADDAKSRHRRRP